MSRLAVEFAFEIGDIVFVRCSQHTIGSRPAPFIIVERIAQQCPGGVQLQYRVQAPNGTAGPYQEITLAKEEPAYRPMTQACLNDIAGQRQAEAKLWSNDLYPIKTDKKQS